MYTCTLTPHILELIALGLREWVWHNAGCCATLVSPYCSPSSLIHVSYYSELPWALGSFQRLPYPSRHHPVAVTRVPSWRVRLLMRGLARVSSPLGLLAPLFTRTDMTGLLHEAWNPETMLSSGRVTPRSLGLVWHLERYAAPAADLRHNFCCKSSPCACSAYVIMLKMCTEVTVSLPNVTQPKRAFTQ